MTYILIYTFTFEDQKQWILCEVHVACNSLFSNDSSHQNRLLSSINIQGILLINLLHMARTIFASSASTEILPEIKSKEKLGTIKQNDNWKAVEALWCGPRQQCAYVCVWVCVYVCYCKYSCYHFFTWSIMQFFTWLVPNQKLH